MAEMPPKKPLAPKRSRSSESVSSCKHAKLETMNEAELSDEKTSSLKVEIDHSYHMLDFIEPRGELEEALEPLTRAVPIDFGYLLPTMSKLMALVPNSEHSKLTSEQDVKMIETAMTNVGKAFVGLAEISAYVKATYEDRFELAKELKKTEAELENAQSNLRKKRKAVWRLQHQIRELKERHPVELKDTETRAVEAFKASAEFAKILEDEHQQGIEECRYHIEQRRPHWDLSFLDIP